MPAQSAPPVIRRTAAGKSVLLSNRPSASRVPPQTLLVYNLIFYAIPAVDLGLVGGRCRSLPAPPSNRGTFGPDNVARSPLTWSANKYGSRRLSLAHRSGPASRADDTVVSFGDGQPINTWVTTVPWPLRPLAGTGSEGR